MQKFKHGDRVVIVNDSWNMGIKGRSATVMGTATDFDGTVMADIKIDDWHSGHCGSYGEVGNDDRWNVSEDEIELLQYEDVDPIIDEQVLLPTDSKERKKIPLASGVFDYFTAALIEVAKVSFEGNFQHNPGEPLHWAQDKSTDHADTLLRHFAERGTRDTDGQRHSAKVAWRALALLQMELQNDGYPKARGAR